MVELDTASMTPVETYEEATKAKGLSLIGSEPTDHRTYGPISGCLSFEEIFGFNDCDL
jgi:hypothetical protein